MGISDFFEYSFLLRALIATILLAMTCGLLGPLVVAKRSAFMGAAVSHSTLLSFSLASVIFSAKTPLLIFITTVLITLILVIGLAASTYRQNLPSDTFIGAFFSVTMGMGVLVHSLYAPSGSDFMGLLFGNILLLNNTDLIIGFILLLTTYAAILFPLKKWIFCLYDEEGALVNGVNLKGYHFLFYVLLTLIIVSFIKIAGAILINTLLIIPGLFGLKFGRSVRQALIISVLFSLTTSITGLILSNTFSTPAGATLSVFQFFSLILFQFIPKLRYFLTKTFSPF